MERPLLGKIKGESLVLECLDLEVRLEALLNVLKGQSPEEWTRKELYLEDRYRPRNRLSPWVNPDLNEIRTRTSYEEYSTTLDTTQGTLNIEVEKRVKQEAVTMFKHGAYKTTGRAPKKTLTMKVSRDDDETLEIFKGHRVEDRIQDLFNHIDREVRRYEEEQKSP